ncbi:hypothetical protein [Streptomyces lydicus]|uniref:hypothetical protein n=1 Tax=Streptomyces lydicus TaxID=47763 RepID=UPI0037990382
MAIPRTRHILTLGNVPAEFLDSAASLWRADEVNQAMSPGQSVLLLVDQDGTGPAEYIKTLQDLDHHGIPVGIIPHARNSSSIGQLSRLLDEETIRVDLSRCRFRLTESPEANLPTAPYALRRARHDDPVSVAEDLDADLLVLQGHAGPVDAGFGKWLTLCSRPLHRSGHSPVFPCFGTDRCFRQELHGRSALSTAGLFNPADLTPSLLVIDGCGTLPAPGSIFRYETSIARSVMASRVRAAVLTHGVSAAPLSALIVFLGSLASGYTLGEAVREANQHGQASHSPTSIAGSSVAPWGVVGNPEVRVVGLPVREVPVRPARQGVECEVTAQHLDAQFGGIVSLVGLPQNSGPFDVTCHDRRWARGVLSPGGRAYLWLSGGGAPPRRKPEGNVTLSLSPRPAESTAPWRRRAKWIQVGKVLLGRMAETCAERGGPGDSLRTLVSLWDEVTGSVERVALAATPLRQQYLAPPLASLTAGLTARIRELDRTTARTVAAVAPTVGARVSRLWSPPWISQGPACVTEPCPCGCAIVGTVRRHPLWDLARVELRCPACGPVGDVPAHALPGPRGAMLLAPTVTGGPAQRAVRAGTTVTWRVRRQGGEDADGFVSASLFDPYRQHQVRVDVRSIEPLSTVDLAVEVPDDWPAGLSQAVIVVAAGGALAFLDFDLMVTSEVPRGVVGKISSQSAGPLAEGPARRSGAAELQAADGADGMPAL